MHVKYVVVVIVCLLFVVTLCHRHAYLNGTSKDPELLQLTMDKLTVDLLTERQPILVEDALVDAQAALLQTVFRNQYIRKEMQGEVLGPVRCRARYTVITCTSPDERVLRLVHEGKRSISVDIRMWAGQALIMPPGWIVEYAKGGGGGCYAMSLHDLFTFFWQ